jgi:hypothetical protein
MARRIGTSRSPMLQSSSKPPRTPLKPRRGSSTTPMGLTPCCGLYASQYTHPCQAGRTSRRGPGAVNSCLPSPPYSRYPDAITRICPSASLCARATYIVVDLEEPRSLRPTIGWPASGAMHHPAYQIRGIPLPRTRVNRLPSMRLSPPGGIMDVVADRPVGETWVWQ